jgi:hypothetical protein
LIAHRRLYDRYYASDPQANRSLGFHLHGYRRLEGWRITQILTPWMIARLWFPEDLPPMPLPDNWQADADYDPLGTEVNLPAALGGGVAHLNYDPSLGHYLVQPITLEMLPYTTAQAAFEAWSHGLQLPHINLIQAG